MDEHIDWNRLGRYLAGEASREEIDDVVAWIGTDPDRMRAMDDLRQICNLAKRAPNKFDVDKAWEKVDRKTSQDGKLTRFKDRAPIQYRKKRFPLVYQILGLLVLIGIAVVLLVPLQQDETPVAPSEKVYATLRGQRATLNLVDGTSVLLNVESKITIPVTFTSDVREVYVEGEAFFKVAPDADRPFRVHTGNAIIQVLGTEFSVRSWGGSERVQVVVAEGTVSLRERNQHIEAATVLNRADLGLLTEEGRVRVKRNVAMDAYLAWTEGRLSFDRTPLSEVFEEIERWYDLDIRLSEEVAGDALLTATFTDEPLREILNVVAESMKLRYEVDGRNVAVFPVLANPDVEVLQP